MEICTTKAALRSAVSGWRASGDLIGLVPTMGALHEGHLTLVRSAKADCGRVVASIFVNPTQFGDPADLAKYPRTEKADLAALEAEGVDAVFMPAADEMYHPEAQTIVETEALAGTLMGALRPGHYRGVCTVVAKLLNCAMPDTAYFGEKDYQQLLVIKTMVRDLDMPFEIKGVATVREEDGLAMSSRNARLEPADRTASVVLSRSLALAVMRIESGAVAEDLEAEVAAFIKAEPRATVETVDIRDAQTLGPLSGAITRPAVILLAARFGNVLLIDQRVATPKGNS